MTYLQESTSLDINTGNAMLTSNAKRIFCNNVTCFGTNKSCSSRSHLSGCFKCSSLLACKAARGTAFNLFSNYIVFLLYLLYLPSLSPADCFQEFIFEQEGNSHWNKLGFFGHIKCSLNVNKGNGMLTSNAQRIFCDNVTCFATNKSCSSRSHLSGCFKCSSLLACKAVRVQLSTCFPIT